MAINECKYLTLEDAASALANDLVSTLNEAVSLRGKALLAISGGKTPRKVFKYLLKQRLNWNNITITLTDERWLPGNHPESNENLVRSYLLNDLSADATFIPLYGGKGSLELDVDSCELKLKNLPLPFDAVYLGIGADGHFASLFPEDEALDVSDSYCVGVAATDSRIARISLTTSTILNTRKIYLLFSGEEKYSVYQRAKTPGSFNEIPLRLILSEDNISIEVYYAL
ncbi:MAG: 6-phosphogluconolactonase [Bacteroidetes bacterium]|nr:MAG: 6-phosphogluconolactonase [Bacteroidota bacterium]